MIWMLTTLTLNFLRKMTRRTLITEITAITETTTITTTIITTTKHGWLSQRKETTPSLGQPSLF